MARQSVDTERMKLNSAGADKQTDDTEFHKFRELTASGERVSC